MFPDDLLLIKNLFYTPFGLVFENVELEKESLEYGASRFNLRPLDGLGKRRVFFRSAKRTPTKIGFFTVFWKRSLSGPITPYEAEDPFDFLMVTIGLNASFGHFVFPKSVLLHQGILSSQNREGKRAFRLYSPWEAVSSDQAQKTKEWQAPYFFEKAQKIPLFDF